MDRAWRIGALLLASGCSPSTTPAFTDAPPSPVAPPPLRWSAGVGLTQLPPPTVFVDRTDALGLDAPHQRVSNPELTDWLTGPGWADLDGDGRLDIVTTGQRGGNRVFLQRDGAFQRVPGGLEDLPGMGLSLADADNDGDPDLFLSSGDPDVLALNDGFGLFTPTSGGGAFTEKAAGVASAWADFDGDGILDVYATNYLCHHCGEPQRSEVDRARDDLWRGLGDGRFEPAGDRLGDPQLRGGMAMQPTWFDFDDDGDLDLYVVVDRGAEGEPQPGEVLRRNALFRNDGPGCGGWCFSEVAREVGLDQRIDGMCAAIGDFDNDGDLDVFMTDTDRGYLMRNEGGVFVDATLAAGLGRPMIGWGCAFLDYDNDGWLDLFAGGGVGSADALWRNRGDGTFDEQPGEVPTDPGESSSGVAVGDWDDDGAPDLLLGVLGRSYRLLSNRLHNGNGWLTVELVGEGPGGRDAVGARVEVTTDDGLVQLREVRRGSSLGSGEDPRLHFGLGGRSIASAVVRWPDGSEELISALRDRVVQVLKDQH